MSSTFQLPSSTSQSPSSTPAFSRTSPTYSSSEPYSDDEDTLPYPTELPRSDFLDPSFDAATYLSTLRNRHQTLEDLRSDLRQRSQLLTRELLDLVNGNYEDFIALGEDLRGGEEKVEGVRVGVLGFKREVEGIKRVVDEREGEVKRLLGERREVQREVGVGRALLEIETQVMELEEALGIRDGGLADEYDDDGEDEEGGDAEASRAITRMRRLAREYVLLCRAIERVGAQHPFLVDQRSRITGVRNSLFLDLASLLRQAKRERAQDDLLVILRIYTLLDAQAEGVRALSVSV